MAVGTWLAAAGSIDWSRHQLYVVSGIVVLLLVSNALHEAGHAVVAWWAGDRRDAIRRRMTLNPLNHVHWFLTVVLPIVTYLFIRFPFGGAKPVMVDAGKIGPRKMALVALAGPFGNALFAVVCAVVTAALMAFGVINEANAINDPDPFKRGLYQVLILSIWFSVTLVVLNLIPLPPADGSRVLGMFMSDRVRTVYYRMAPVTVILLILLVMWASGFLHQYVPWVGRGYPGGFDKARIWVEDQVFALVDPIKSIGGK